MIEFNDLLNEEQREVLAATPTYDLSLRQKMVESNEYQAAVRQLLNKYCEVLQAMVVLDGRSENFQYAFQHLKGQAVGLMLAVEILTQGEDDYVNGH